ncbi:MAG: hypothetical protein WDA09_01460 [Bacteriovoracaceae bacterium]
MSKRNSLSLLSLSVLLMMVACGSDSSSSSKEKKGVELNTVCDRLDCLTSVDWKLVLQGQNFPEKTKLIIDNETVLDECLGKQQYSVNRSTAPMTISLEYFKVPQGPINIKIVDQGWDCRSHTTFLDKRGVSYELEKSNFGGQQLVIDL